MTRQKPPFETLTVKSRRLHAKGKIVKNSMKISPRNVTVSLLMEQE